MHNGLSVVIPNYNGIELLPITLPTVFSALENSGLPFEVIVSDDCSTDQSVHFLSQHFPSVLVIQNSKNSGFAITANKGAQAAHYDLLLVLNSDVKLEPNYFEHLFRYFERPDTFGVMGRIIGWNDEVIQDGAKYPSFQNAKIKMNLNYIMENEDEMKNGLYSMYISGANALVDRSSFLQLGGFNELFSPFYVEDYDLSLRAWRMGWKCYYEHFAICRHKTSTTIKSNSRKQFIRTITNRNKWFLHAIHLTGIEKFLWMIQMMGEVLFQTLLLKFYYTKAFRMFIADYGKVRSSRSQLKVLGNGQLKSAREVAGFIWASVKDKKIKIF